MLLVGCMFVSEHGKDNRIDTVVVVDTQPKHEPRKKENKKVIHLVGKVGASLVVVGALGKLLGLW